MAFDAATLPQLLLLLIWTCFSTCSDKSKHPIFLKAISGQDVVEELLSSVSLICAPGLFEILQSSTPPTISFFKALPSEFTKRWGIYLLTLEKSGCRPKIYIGSGTSIRLGVSERLDQYANRGKYTPKYVAKALDDGYVITHNGLLCWAPIPPAGLAPLLRVLFIALEATFACVFWAMYSRTSYMSQLCLWDLSKLEYDGLCSHIPFHEAVAGDFSLSPEELEVQAAQILANRAERKRVASRAAYAQAKSNDPEALQVKSKAKSRKHAEENPASVKAAGDRYRAKAKESRK